MAGFFLPFIVGITGEFVAELNLQEPIKQKGSAS